MQHSLWIDSSHHPDEVLERARWADAAGFYGFWYADHYMPNTGSAEIVDGPVHECWSMLPAIAAVTERMRIGPLVSPTSVHHPALLANRAATIDQLSHGRMVLGLGAGWQINEHHAYGIELQAPKERVDRFEEAIQIVRSMLSEERTTFDGAYYTISDAPSQPAPVQSPLPLLVGTGGNRMLRITARFADEWNTWGAPELAAEKLDAFRRACETVDVDPANRWTSVQALVFLTDTPDAAAAAIEGPMGSRSIAGTPEQLIERISAYADLGFDEFILSDFVAGDSPAARAETLARLHEDVLPHL